MAVAALLPAPLPRRLRHRVHPPGRRRRGASHQASGVGRAAGTPALAPRLPRRRRRSRRRARAGSADGPRHLRAPRATLTTTTLARALAPRPRTRRLLEWSRVRGRRSRTPRSGVASRRTPSIQRNVWPVLGRTAGVRSANLGEWRDATCSAGRISRSKTRQGGMGAWTGQFRRQSCRNSARPPPSRRGRCPRPRRPMRGLCPRLRPRLLRRWAPRKQVLGLLAEGSARPRGGQRRGDPPVCPPAMAPPQTRPQRAATVLEGLARPLRLRSHRRAVSVGGLAGARARGKAPPLPRRSAHGRRILLRGRGAWPSLSITSDRSWKARSLELSERVRRTCLSTSACGLTRGCDRRCVVCAGAEMATSASQRLRRCPTRLSECRATSAPPLAAPRGAAKPVPMGMNNMD